MDNQTQPNIPPVQPLPQTPITSPTNWFKILLFIISGLIIIAGAVFAGIQIGKNQITKQQTITEQPTAFPTQVVVNPTAISTTTLPTELNPTTNPTADWKTYKNSSLGFEFKYPSNWTEKLPTTNDPTIIYIWSNEELGGQNGADSLKYYIFLDEEKTLPTGVNYSEEIINNKTVKITTDLPSRMGCLSYFFEKPILSYVKITLCPFNIPQSFVKQNEYLSIFKQILSTFKFINSNTTVYSSEGQSCGGLAGPAGNAQCTPGLTCQHKNPNDPNDIGTCIK